jgi:hypothetical protein
MSFVWGLVIGFVVGGLGAYVYLATTGKLK